MGDNIETEEIGVLEEELHGCQVTSVEIRSESAAEHLHKAVGTYITIYTNATLDGQAELEPVGECLAAILGRILRPYYGGKLCICGLGNPNIPADSLGPEVTQTLPLRFFSDNKIKGNFCEVCSIAPGTAWSNNMDTELIVGGVAKEIKADCLLLVDAIATKEVSKLFRTIQLSTAGGTTPYLAERKSDWSVVGVPVLALGVPLSIPLSILSSDSELKETTLTTTLVNDMIAAAVTIITYAILRVCWPSLSKSECFLMTKAHRDPIPYSALLEEGDD